MVLGVVAVNSVCHRQAHAGQVGGRVLGGWALLGAGWALVGCSLPCWAAAGAVLGCELARADSHKVLPMLCHRASTALHQLLLPPLPTLPV